MVHVGLCDLVYIFLSLCAFSWGLNVPQLDTGKFCPAVDQMTKNVVSCNMPSYPVDMPHGPTQMSCYCWGFVVPTGSCCFLSFLHAVRILLQGEADSAPGFVSFPESPRLPAGLRVALVLHSTSGLHNLPLGFHAQSWLT